MIKIIKMKKFQISLLNSINWLLDTHFKYKKKTPTIFLSLLRLFK